MNTIHSQSEANRTLEGGIFYPTGHIVVALPDSQAALQVRGALETAGIGDVMHSPAADMAREARENLEGVTSALSFGASVPVREKQLELAEAGCDFLIIPASSEAEEERVLQLLAGADVRYAVKYRTLIIENLVPQIPSAQPDSQAARVP